MKNQIMDTQFLYAILTDKVLKEKKIQVLKEQIILTEERLNDLKKWLDMAQPLDPEK